MTEIQTSSFRLQLGHNIWTKTLHQYLTKMLDTGRWKKESLAPHVTLLSNYKIDRIPR
jgi:hypothetical protein